MPRCGRVVLSSILSNPKLFFPLLIVEALCRYSILFLSVLWARMELSEVVGLVGLVGWGLSDGAFL